MAYNANNETREELLRLDKNARGDKLVVAKIKNTNTGNESVDIRNFYTDTEGEVRPTSKGVRFASEILMDVVKALVEGLEENEVFDLKDWLDVHVEALDSDETEDEAEVDA